MSIRNNYNHTIYASYIGYITQAVVNNFVPLLFLFLIGMLVYYRRKGPRFDEASVLQSLAERAKENEEPTEELSESSEAITSNRTEKEE